MLISLAVIFSQTECCQFEPFKSAVIDDSGQCKLVFLYLKQCNLN